MEIFGINITRAKNLDKSKPQAANIKPIERQNTRVAQDIDNWRAALQEAENIYNYDRRLLQEIFLELKFDAHITAVTNQIISEITGSDYRFQIDDETDEEATAIIQSGWFTDFLKLCVEAEFYGYSLIELGAIKDNKFSYAKGIDRRYVVPEYNVVKKDLYSYANKDGYNFNEPPYNSWTVFVDTKDFGLYNRAVPLWVYKKQAYNYWAEYQQIFAMPLRLGLTDIRDAQRRDNMAKMLKNMGAAAWGVFDTEDKIEFVQASGSIGNPVFQTMISDINGELSKLMVGQTMTTEDGSSRSQAEVHQDVKNSLIEMYYRNVERVVNDQLYPLMVQHRIIKPGLKFEFVWSEKDLNQIQKIEAVAKLAPYFDFDPEYIKDFTGLEVNTRVVPVSGSPLNRLKNYYGSTDAK